jgi:hypothetical protein
VSEGTRPDGLQQPGLGPTALWSGPRGGGRWGGSVCQRRRCWETLAGGGQAPAPARAVANLLSGQPAQELGGQTGASRRLASGQGFGSGFPCREVFHIFC